MEWITTLSLCGIASAMVCYIACVYRSQEAPPEPSQRDGLNLYPGVWRWRLRCPHCHGVIDTPKLTVVYPYQVSDN